MASPMTSMNSAKAVSGDSTSAMMPSMVTETRVKNTPEPMRIGEPEGATKAYLDWIKSPAGQAVLAEEKFVPLGN